MIARNSYEVGAEFADRFIAASTGHAELFPASTRDGHFMFDLPEFIAMRLRLAGIGLFGGFGPRHLCRARKLLFLPPFWCICATSLDYGRQVAAIALFLTSL
jgi:hypothetical protein